MANSDPLKADDLQALLDKAAREFGAPGATFAISKGDQQVAAVTGYLNIEDKSPVLSGSMFQIGSVTKVVTATLIMCLVDAGLIELDEPAKSYLPELVLGDSKVANTVTVRQLLNHTSGIAGDFFLDCGSGSDVLERFVDRCAALSQAHPMGDGFSYSNAAYNIAGRIAEKVSGLSFDAALSKYIFEPMGLRETLSELTKVPGRSVSAGHMPDPDDPETWKPLDTIYTLPISGGPAGSTLLMSAADLVAFGRMHVNGGVADNGKQVVSKESVAEMQKVHVTLPMPMRDIAKWGLGWFILESDGGELIGHDGATVGQSAYLRIHRESGTVAALIVNGGAANQMAVKLFDQTMDQLTGVPLKPAPVPAASQPEDLSIYEGEYDSLAFNHKIYVRDDKLMKKTVLRLEGFEQEEDEVEIKLIGDHQFLWGADEGAYPAVCCFLDFDSTGKPQTFFAGLRTCKRIV